MRDVVLAVILPACAISAIYLVPFARDPALLPYGSDTPGYMWRGAVVRTLGLDSLRPDTFPPPISPLGDRPVYPVVAGVLQSITGVDPATFAWLSPAIFATIAGLAAGVLAVDGVGEPRSRAPLYAIGIGGSAYLAWTAVGYATNLSFVAIALAVAVIISVPRRSRASPPFGGAMLGAGFLTHWMFGTTFASVLLAFVGVLAVARRVIRSRREHRRSDQWMPTISRVRGIGGLLLVSVAIGGAGFLAAAPERPHALPPVDEGIPAVAVKLATREAGLLLWLTVPLAIVAVIVGIRGSRRWAVILLGLWALLLPAGLIAWYGLHLPFPPYRWNAFALGLPILAIAAGPWAGEYLSRRRGPLARRLGMSVAVLVSAALVGGGITVWWSDEPRITPEERIQLGVASRYLDPLPEETPVFVVVAPARRRSTVDQVFSGLPAERLPFVRIVPARIDERSPGLGLGIAVPPDAVILFPGAFNKRGTDVGTELSAGLRLLMGPAPGAGIDPPSAPRAPNPARLAWYVAVSIVVLIVAGGGWSLLIELRVAGRLALSPAIGMAMLGLLGVALTRASVRPDGPGAIVALTLTSISGFLVAAIARRQRRSVTHTSGAAPSPQP